jgi:predicted DsbA family dithiol-disulfide isomerase
VALAPNIPPEGQEMPLDPVDERMKAARENALRLGRELGIELKRSTLLPNSNLAHQAAEYARDAGVFDAYHRRLFEAYFFDGQNIGLVNVLCRLGRELGLDSEEMKAVLDKGDYRKRVYWHRLDASMLGIRSVPMFIVGGRIMIAGPEPYDTFRDAVTRVKSIGSVNIPGLS